MEGGENAEFKRSWSSMQAWQQSQLTPWGILKLKCTSVFCQGGWDIIFLYQLVFGCGHSGKGHNLGQSTLSHWGNPWRGWLVKSVFPQFSQQLGAQKILHERGISQCPSSLSLGTFISKEKRLRIMTYAFNSKSWNYIINHNKISWKKER